jgi:hypothetical protein
LKSRGLVNLSSLLVGIAFALSAGASQFTISSRVTLGPSLNKDIPSTSPSSTAAPVASAPAASTMTPPAPLPASLPASSLGSSPASATAPLPAQPAVTTQPTIVVIQPERPANAMERAGQLVRSVLRKIDPNTPVVAPRDAVDLNRSRSRTGMSVNTTTSLSIPPNSSLTAASDSTADSTVTTAATQRSAQPLPLNTSMNKQQKNVVNADPSKEQRQLQRGILNEQKMSVGMNQ